MATLSPKRLSGRDLEIFYRHVSGMLGKDIAQDLGISEQTVSNTINSDWARNELALLHARTLDKIAAGNYSPLVIARAHASEAMAIQVNLMRNPHIKPEVRARIADSVLDRAGFKPAARVETLDLNDIFEKMSAEEIELYANNGTLPARFSGTAIAQFLGGTDTIDITPEPESDNYSPPSRAQPSTEIELE